MNGVEKKAALGEALRARRLALCWTEEELGALAGVPGAQVAELEAGRADRVRVDQFLALCQALELDPAALLGA